MEPGDRAGEDRPGDLPAELAPVAFLLGSWSGGGRGDYPTGSPFRYLEEMRFSHEGLPVLAYEQRAWSPDSGEVLHSERGFWIPGPDGTIEATLAHPIGVTEAAAGSVGSGTVGPGTVELSSTALGSTPGGLEVTRLERSLRVEGDVLRYELRMAAVGHPLQFHLSGELHRRPD